MKLKITIFYPLLTCLVLLSACKVQEEAKKPNIIIIFTDDQGYGDLGCYGSPNILTPNIDRMAAEGARFTSFYAAAFCGPSRAQLMTGCYHARVSHSFNELPGGKTGLHTNEITIAEVLKTVGYNTMLIGKWHLGDAPQFMPTKQGFDHFFGFPYSHDMWPYHYRTVIPDLEDTLLLRQVRERAERLGYSANGAWKFPPLPLIYDEKVIEENPDMNQLTTRFTEKALEFIEDNSREPFFLYLAHIMPHTPLAASEKFQGISDRGLYGDAVMEIDWSCGEIFRKLKELGIDEHTLVIFSSDNGPTSKYGIDGGSAGLLTGSKGSMNEGGMRVPAIFRWPNRIPSGISCNEIASTIDLLPTIAYLAGADIPGDRVIDGENILPLLSGEAIKSPHEFLHYYAGSRSDQVSNYRAIRDDKWKLFVSRNKAGELIPGALYDLGTDPSEIFDRSQQYPEIVNELLEDAQEFSSELEAHKRPVGRIKKNF